MAPNILADNESRFSNLTASKETQQVLKRLQEQVYISDELKNAIDNYPKNKTAAVLLLLFERGDQLHVLLTTRSKQLRTHPGQTALPGGKREPQDSDALATALRESQEECGLDPNLQSLHFITYLPPFLSQWKLLVTPVVMYLEDTSVIDNLLPGVDEVDRIFSHPLKAILDPSIVGTVQEELSEKGGEDWPYQEELYNTSDSRWTQIRNSIYRMHRFRSTGSPIKGLTADILILAAQIGYEEETKYERYGPDQPTHERMVLWAVEDLAGTNPTSGAKLPALAPNSSTGLIEGTSTPPLTIGFKSRFEESTH